jgi:manganese transport protein
LNVTPRLSLRSLLDRLPKTPTAPFCPSEVRGSVFVSARSPWYRRVFIMAGPGLLIAVGYMDPGNWATDIAAGSAYGESLLWVVVASGLAAMLLQTLSLRLGLASGHDLAQICRQVYSPRITRFLWVLAELGIIACDVAEVLGSALAFKLLFGIPLLVGIGLTALDTVFVLGLKGHGFRQVEAIVTGLVMIIGLCFAIEIALAPPNPGAVALGLIPRLQMFHHDAQALVLAIGIVGATVMPHNLYLHSSIVQTRRVAPDDASRRDAIRISTLDAVVSLSLAILVNAMILSLAASAFHAHDHRTVADIGDAYHLLDPIVGGGAAILFGVGLLASGQSSTFTATIAGQILMEGFLELKIPCWQRRLITRALAIIPAAAGVIWLGDSGVGKLLILSQIVLSLQLPFAIWPLIRFTSERRWMGSLVTPSVWRFAAQLVFVVICVANLWLLISL